MFSICPPLQGGGVPRQIQMGGTLARSGWGVPPARDGVPPIWTWMGGTPSQIEPVCIWDGVPPCLDLDLGWGTPPSGSGPRMGYPPPFSWDNRRSTRYPVSSMPLAFTQEDFVVKQAFFTHHLTCLARINRVRLMILKTKTYKHCQVNLVG